MLLWLKSLWNFSVARVCPAASIRLWPSWPANAPPEEIHSHVVKTYAVEAYLLGELSEAERSALEEHISDCSECRRELEISRDLVADLKNAACEAPKLRAKVVAIRDSSRFRPGRPPG